MVKSVIIFQRLLRRWPPFALRRRVWLVACRVGLVVCFSGCLHVIGEPLAEEYFRTDPDRIGIVQARQLLAAEVLSFTARCDTSDDSNYAYYLSSNNGSSNCRNFNTAMSLFEPQEDWATGCAELRYLLRPRIMECLLFIRNDRCDQMIDYQSPFPDYRTMTLLICTRAFSSVY